MNHAKLFVSALVLAGALASCGKSGETTTANDAETVAQPTAGAVTFVVDPSQSTLEWSGAKITSGHRGDIQIQSGNLALEGGNVTAGNFVIDMKTIREVGSDDPESAAKLTGHLSSADFFDVEKYPLSKFEVTGSTRNQTDSTSHTIQGNLTIKDVTKNISFPANVVVEGDNLKADAKFSINRNDWGVTYGSGLSGAIGDRVIKDNIDYKVALVGKKQAL